VLARYGGEEIGVILPGTGLQGAQQLAEAIRNGIEQMRIRHDGQPDGVLRITVSIGVGTVFARHCRIMNMPEALLEIVDEALYMAKQRGRNCVVTGYLAESPKDGVP
jgi:diguanylate cyclase (GGDEF)-like protein